jgi:hypothetical protein
VLAPSEDPVLHRKRNIAALSPGKTEILRKPEKIVAIETKTPYILLQEIGTASGVIDILVT